MVASGMTYICTSDFSPTKNVLVFSVPSNTGIEFEPASFKNWYNPVPSSEAINVCLV